jgi:hypothetical protein
MTMLIDRSARQKRGNMIAAIIVLMIAAAMIIIMAIT